MQRLRCYHNIPFDQVSFGVVHADSNYSYAADRPSFRWLEEQIGFYPIFLACGGEGAVSITRYRDQFLILERLKKGQTLGNNVLFEFPLEALSGVVFTDYNWWCCVNNTIFAGREPHPWDVKRTLKRSWRRAEWIAHARRGDRNVQPLVPNLDLRNASAAWARNKETARKLERLGFRNVSVKRSRFGGGS